MSTLLPATLHPPDAYQQAVITSDASSIRVLAPAGSGKTETLARRAAHQIEQGIFAHRILILTFDTQARASFQRALQRLDVSGNVEIRTLNAFGLRLLGNLFPETRNRTSQVFHGSAEPLLAELTDQTDGTALTELFSTLKSHLFDPQHLKTRAMKTWVERNYDRLVPERFLANNPAASTAKEFATQLAREFVRYEESLAARNLIDFDDQKLRSYQLLEAQPDKADRVRSRYDEVIVDEVQDINPLDQKLIEIISRDANLIITGDDDQAIYGFRWASANYLIRPDKAFNRTFVSYELQTNYRCPRTILERSSQLIQRNRDRVKKSPKSGVNADGTITTIPAAEKLAGSRAIVALLQKTLADNPVLSWGDVAILARRNQYLDEMQVQLITAGIPHVVKSGRDLIQTWSTALGLLDLSTMLRDSGSKEDADLRPAIAAYTWLPRAVRNDQIDRFRGLGFTEAIATLADLAPARTMKTFQDALALLQKQRSVSDELTIIETRFMGIDPKKDRDKETADRPLELLRTILDGRKSTREEAIDRLRGFIDQSSSANTKAGPRIELATYHGAKGRQWHTVVLPWVAGTTTPDPLARNDFGEIEAERRLFYVAMTRAAQTLVIGHPTPESKENPSFFLHDAGILDRAAAPEPSPAKPAATQTQLHATPARAASRETASSTARPAARQTNRSNATAKSPAATTEYIDVADITRILKMIERDGGATVDYAASPELLFPLQLALLLEGIPYQAPAENDLLYSWVFRDLFKHVTKSRLRVIKAVNEPEYPAYKRAFVAMTKWLEHRHLNTPQAKANLMAAIDAATAHRRRKTPVRVTFRRVAGG